MEGTLKVKIVDNNFNMYEVNNPNLQIGTLYFQEYTDLLGFWNGVSMDTVYLSNSQALSSAIETEPQEQNTDQDFALKLAAILTEQGELVFGKKNSGEESG